MQLHCPYCGSATQIADASRVYRKPGYGRVLLCSAYPACDAYVGMHEGRCDAKGSLARGPLRRLRRQCHALFDPLWQSVLPLHRRQVYEEASQFFKVRHFHVGHLDEAGCQDFLQRFPEFERWLMRRVDRRARAGSKLQASASRAPHASAVSAACG